MDYLRWILLAAVIVIVAIIVFFSRSHKKNNYEMPLDEVDDVPSFSASKDVDSGWVDGVGPIKVSSSFDTDGTAETGFEKVPEKNKEEFLKEQTDAISTVQDNTDETINRDSSEKENNIVEVGSAVEAELTNDVSSEDLTKDESIDDVISIYVLAKNNEQLNGEKILSACYGLHLEHGEMKIFHRHLQTSRKEIQFSVANIQVPGWFDVDEMHQIKTNGVSFFMQVNLVDKPSDALSEMLICAHSMSQMLGATLCNAQRKPLDEKTTNELREKVKRLEKNKAKLL